MEKKHVFAIVLITIFAFSATAFGEPCVANPDPNNPLEVANQCPCDPTAADNCGDLDDTTNGCRECSKCELGNVPCPGQSIDSQGNVTSGTVYPFDYDGEPYVDEDDYPALDTPRFGSYGYCKGFNYREDIRVNDPGDSFRDCKFIMNVCRCPEACDILPGTKVAIQMIIKTQGVYFAGRYADGNPVSKIRFDLMGENVEQEFCRKNDGMPFTTEMGQGQYFYAADGETLVAMEDDMDTQRTMIRHFPQAQYYLSYNERYTADGQFVSEVSNPGVPLGGDRTQSLAPINKVVALESVGEYMFNQHDAEVVGQDKECHIWVDIPPMRINPGEYNSGDNVRVVVRLVFNRESPGICPTCHPPTYCECERVVAKLCCGETTESKCIYFPYVFTGMQPWVTGIGVTNLAGTANTNLTFTVTTGNSSYTASNILSGATDAWILDTLVNGDNALTWNPQAPPSGYGWLKVSSDVNIDGYSFVTDGTTFGAGTLPRLTCPK